MDDTVCAGPSAPDWGALLVFDSDDGEELEAAVDEALAVLEERGIAYRLDWLADCTVVVRVPKGHEADAVWLALMPCCIAARRL